MTQEKDVADVSAVSDKGKKIPAKFAGKTSTRPAKKAASAPAVPAKNRRTPKKNAGADIAEPPSGRDAPPGTTPSAKTAGKKNPPATVPAVAEFPATEQHDSAVVTPLSAPQQTTPASAVAEIPAVEQYPALPSQEAGEGADAPPRKRRSRRGGRRRNKKQAAQPAEQQQAQAAALPAPESQEAYLPVEAFSSIAGEDDTRDSYLDDIAGEQLPAAGRGGKSRSRKSGKADEEEFRADRKMLLSVLSGEQVEVVLIEENMVQEYYVEMLHQAKMKGNIYKGTVSNIDSNLQAAFVAYAGGTKNGFLQIDEVHPEYYQIPHDGKGHKYPLIHKALKPGQEILVQVVKEPAGSKGAFLTSYLSLPGRFLVLTPGREQIGVSRKVENEEERARLRELLGGLNPGKGLGVIIRTASMGTSKTNLQRDLQFLKRLWKEVRDRGKKEKAPALIYQELDLSTRAVRDYLTDTVKEVWVDDEATAEQVASFASLLSPRRQDSVHLHNDPEQTLFERFSVQKQLSQIHAREVTLPSGGRLVFDQTEALTAIDINSGRSSGKSNFEDMAFRTNLEAARIIPLQLRLRDIGGQVVIDFIEMRDRDHWREVEKNLRNGMKGDRARYDIGKVSAFGMLELVRQRLGSSAISVSTEICPFCKGTGIRRNMEWQAMQALRDIRKMARLAAGQGQARATYQAEQELAVYLLNAKRQMLVDMEKQFGITIVVSPGDMSAG